MQFPTTSPTTAAPAVAAKPRRMSAANATRGRIKVPLRVLLYGTEKVGKSTFAAGAPKPWWLPRDNGSEELDVKRLPQPKTWLEALEGIDELEQLVRAKECETAVIDPLNHFEPLVHAHVSGDAAKAVSFRQYDDVNIQWRLFLAGLERIWLLGANVIICAHSLVKRFDDPAGLAFDRYEIAMNAKAAGMFKQWVATILFAKQDAYGMITEKDQKKAKAYGSNAHVMHTEGCAAWDAGNRQGLPKTMPLSWNDFMHAVTHREEQVAVLRTQIEEGLIELAKLDPESASKTEAKVREYLKNATVDVAEVANKLAAKLGETRERIAAAAAATTTVETTTNAGESK